MIAASRNAAISVRDLAVIDVVKDGASSERCNRRERCGAVRAACA